MRPDRQKEQSGGRFGRNCPVDPPGRGTAVIAMAEPVETHFLWRPQLRDLNDEMVLEAAVNGRADALVTFNLRDYGTAPSQFGVELLLPRIAIGRIRR